MLKPVLICGDKNAGKTAYLKFLAGRLNARGLTVGGILSEGVNENGRKIRYDAVDLRRGARWPLASLTADFPAALRYGPFYFDRQVFRRGNRILRDSLGSDAIILDEFGPLEKEGRGFREGLDFLLQNYRGFLFIAVRPGLLNYLRNLLGERSA